jgi:hypothetical protein
MVIAALSLERHDASKMSGVRRLSSLALRRSTSRLKGPATRIAARASCFREEGRRRDVSHFDRRWPGMDLHWDGGRHRFGARAYRTRHGTRHRSSYRSDHGRLSPTRTGTIAAFGNAGTRRQIRSGASGASCTTSPHSVIFEARAHCVAMSTQAQRTGFDGFASSRPGASYFSTGRCNLLARSSRHFLRNLRSLRSNLVSSSLTARMKSVCEVLVVRVGAGMLVS